MGKCPGHPLRCQWQSIHYFSNTQHKLCLRPCAGHWDVQRSQDMSLPSRTFHTVAVVGAEKIMKVVFQVLQ